MNILPAFTLTCLFLLSACSTHECRMDLPIIPLSINDKSLRVEVAATPAARRCGLSHRWKLASNRGMLFVFKQEQQLHFWMQDTTIPLSILYIDAKHIVREHHDLTPHSTTFVSSRARAQYALEANRGWFEDNMVKPGDKVVFTLPENMDTGR
mgnify:CR=1 FL=1